jgi:hypothetical protein
MSSFSLWLIDVLARGAQAGRTITEATMAAPRTLQRCRRRERQRRLLTAVKCNALFFTIVDLF